MNKKKASPSRRSQCDKIKEELSKRAKLNAANCIGVWGNGGPRRHFWFYFEVGKLMLSGAKSFRWHVLSDS